MKDKIKAEIEEMKQGSLDWSSEIRICEGHLKWLEELEENLIAILCVEGTSIEVQTLKKY